MKLAAPTAVRRAKRSGTLGTLTDRQILRLAARNLAQLADDIKHSHTFRGRWIMNDEIDTNAKIEHDIARELARRLRLIAAHQRKPQTGGPQ